MKIIKKISADFFTEFYELNDLPCPIKNVRSKLNQKIYESRNVHSNYPINGNKYFSIYFVPDYFETHLHSDKFRIKKVKHFFKGYAICLDQYTSVDQYLKQNFSKNGKTIIRCKQRLEHCFEITYKVYYGQIDKEEYDFLMLCLFKMLEKRFEQRKDKSTTLRHWNKYKNMYFSLINDQRASLFVINNTNEPIAISLGLHFDNQIYDTVGSYCIDYSKFSLGSIDLYKKLEWCLENDHYRLELGMGDLPYKKRWSNLIYDFNHLTIFPNYNLKTQFIAITDFLKLSFKELIFKIFYIKYKRFKAKIKRTHNKETKEEISEFTGEINNQHMKIDYTSEKYKFLKNKVYSFMFLNLENQEDVNVFKIKNEENSFVVQGKLKTIKLII